MRTFALLIALLLATAGLVLAYPLADRPAAPPPIDPLPVPLSNDPQQQPKIEAVFVLDTTGSMGGLIQAAKENIWSIASSMASAQPTPELSIGLVAFRDRGDEYVTRIIDLSSDLDSVYAQLMDFQANGGGDHPEAVNQALHEAVHRIGWSQAPGAYRTIFLVGDAPPKIYPDEPQYPEIVAQALARGIVVNSIQAGGDAGTRGHWAKIAELGSGAYFQVEQHGSAVAVTTPFDDRLARLSRELDETRLFYGNADRQRLARAKEDAAGKLHAVASPAAQAKRAEFNASAAGSANLLGDSELVDAVTSGKVVLAEVDEAHLPAPLAALAPEERAAHVEQTAQRRQEIAAEIAVLAKERQAHIASTLGDETARRDTLDYRLFETVKAQAAAKGLSYDAAPVH
jgi:hypothetical protein